MLRLLVLSAAILTAGCSPRVRISGAGTIPPHTQLWTEDGRGNLWSYERVAKLILKDGSEKQVGAQMKRQLRRGESVTFENGMVVSSEGAGLRVGAEVMDSLNSMLDRDGTLHRGAFIRTFE